MSIENMNSLIKPNTSNLSLRYNPNQLKPMSMSGYKRSNNKINLGMAVKWLLILAFVVVIAAPKATVVRGILEDFFDDVDLGDGMKMLEVTTCIGDVTGDEISISPDCCKILVDIGWETVKSFVPGVGLAGGLTPKIKEACKGLVPDGEPDVVQEEETSDDVQKQETVVSEEDVVPPEVLG